MYHAVDAGMIRASVFPMAAPMPPWPTPVGEESADTDLWREWIAQVWVDDIRAAAIEFAAPRLADSIREVAAGQCQRSRAVRRTAMSLARYVLRMQYRATPFGLFAGPAPIRIGAASRVDWGTEHRAFGHADAEWLNDVITTLERDPDVLRNVFVVANSRCIVRGSRIALLFQPGAEGPTETTLRRTPAVETVLAMARTPLTVSTLAAKLRSDYPDTPDEQIHAMLHSLVEHRVLLTSLHAPMTCGDALGHLVEQLDTTSVAPAKADELRQVRMLLTRHDEAPQRAQRTLRAKATAKMNALTGVTDRSLVVNLRPDCDIVLPDTVTREAEHALQVITRLTPFPNGPAAWQDYRTRFLERYSMGTIVPLRDLTDPDTGLGFPAGYRGTVLKRPVLATTLRDEHLLTLAQDAALNDQRTVDLTEADIEALALGRPTQVPAHVALSFTVFARSLNDVEDGGFALGIKGLSLSVGITTGRFLRMLEAADFDRMAAAYSGLPTLTAGADLGQVSSPPLRVRTRNVGRAPALMPNVLSVGEYNPDATLDVDHLGVVADARRLYLVSLSTGQVIEPMVMNAVELTNATHPLARFVSELHRSHTATLIPFAWGAAARLPFLPEVRVGRTILSPASWRLRAADLVDGGNWASALSDWRARRSVPRTVYVGNDDQRLRLDLDVLAQQQLLRTELDRRPTVTLREAPPEDAFGWLGRAHEVTVPFVSDQPPAPAAVRRTAVVVGRDSCRLPGASPWAYLKLYGNAARVPELLTAHVPLLLGEVEPLEWWFIRYADPDSHVRLRLRLPSPDAFGNTAQRVAIWAAELRAEGLLQRVRWDTDEPETGRYGSGAALEAAERFFAADSDAALTQIALPLSDSHRQAVTAASFVDIATAFLGTPVAGRAWLTANFPQSDGATALPRDVQALAVDLTSAQHHCPIQEIQGGDAVAQAWATRQAALLAYRTVLESTGIDPAAVLGALLHMHHNRAAGIAPDAEATCRRLARAAALSWTIRTEGAKR
ncbi:lantibiotic dehydratase [Streptomyces graminofaciens]|uniref:lantibiotic dehydratase n=1 Tax=Streptomyces graminofaciens TaxID=68212 RepID=UPI002573B5E5|nr:lantibiotic dehydratase [Streptomyces graminofaciens]